VLVGELPQALRQDAEMYAGCVAGAIQKEEYLGIIQTTGFQHITLQKEKPITIPEDILSKYLSPQEVEAFNNGKTGIFSITVYGEKPGAKSEKPKVRLSEIQNQEGGCAPNSGCC
jgi:hypothetical protein